MVHKPAKPAHRFHLTAVLCASLATLLAAWRMACLPTDVPAEPMPRVGITTSERKTGDPNLVSCETSFVDRALLPTSVGSDRGAQIARWAAHMDDAVKTRGAADVRALVTCNEPALRLAAGVYWFSREAEAVEYSAHLLLDDCSFPSLEGQRSLAEWLVKDVCDIWSATGEHLVRKAANGPEASLVRVAAIDCLLERRPGVGEEELIRALGVPDTGLQYAMLFRAAVVFSLSAGAAGGCNRPLLAEVMGALKSTNYWIRGAALTASSYCAEVRNTTIRIGSWDRSAHVREVVAEAIASDPPLAPDISLRLLVDRAEPVRRSLISKTAPATTWKDAIGNPVSMWKDLRRLGGQVSPP